MAAPQKQVSRIRYLRRAPGRLHFHPRQRSVARVCALVLLRPSPPLSARAPSTATPLGRSAPRVCRTAPGYSASLPGTHSPRLRLERVSLSLRTPLKLLGGAEKPGHIEPGFAFGPTVCHTVCDSSATRIA